MNRTKPIGVRFDPEKLEFVKTREKLKSTQQAVDLLMNKYWWDHKMPVATYREAPPLHLKEEIPEQVNPPETTKQTLINIPTPLVVVQALMRKYEAEKFEVTCREEYQDWEKRVNGDARLTEKQKKTILNAQR